MTAVLVLADGTIFEGISVGAHGLQCGEVVFNTAQTGYQEILTDPSYAGQLITFTYPHIGNVGVNAADMESHRVFANGILMRSFSHTASNWRAEETLEHFLKRQNIFAISEIDTRALTHHLAQHGSEAACMMTGKIDIKKATAAAKHFKALPATDLVKLVTTNQPYSLRHGHANAYHIVVYDFGVKKSILKALFTRGCDLTVIPADTRADQVIALKPDGIVLSNGPGDPTLCTYAISAIKALLQQGLPIMGICLGHQLLALASGAIIKKMRFGHHGANHPIKTLATHKVAISSQNHGYVAVDENLPPCLQVTHRSLFDGTIAGIKRIDVPAFGFQGHPEAGPGPADLNILFDDFISLLEVSCAKAN